ncbi:hypothetical protein B0J14DRAFT_515398 [Halenospora varia]|nr:hypothetical protein B0J14DRAFT_515398 [Halenospora varia]
MSTTTGNSVERTLIVTGPSRADKETLIAKILLKYDAIDLTEWESLNQETAKDPDGDHPGGGGGGVVWKSLKDRYGSAQLRIPNHVIKVTDEGTEAECVILVVAPGVLLEEDVDWNKLDVLKKVGRLIVLINKMDWDWVDWSKEQFDIVVKEVGAQLRDLGVNMENVPVIPVTDSYGDNILEPSTKCPWYTGWEIKNGKKSGTTLLEALLTSYAS